MTDKDRNECVNLEVNILEKLAICVYITKTAHRYWIVAQSIRSLHSLMYELIAYSYEVDVKKEKDRQQEYIIRIEQKDLKSKIKIWQNNLPIT